MVSDNGPDLDNRRSDDHGSGRNRRNRPEGVFKGKIPEIDRMWSMNYRPQSHTFSSKPGKMQSSRRALRHAAGVLPLSPDSAVLSPEVDTIIPSEFEDLVVK